MTYCCANGNVVKYCASLVSAVKPMELIPTTPEVYRMEIEQCKRDVAAIQAENEKLQQQIASRAALLISQEVVTASKEEIISQLRGGYNRPN